MFTSFILKCCWVEKKRKDQSMNVDLSPKPGRLMFEGEGGSYYSWLSSEIPILAEAKVGAAIFVIKPGGFAFPHYGDCSKIGYVVQGEQGVGALISPNSDKTEEIVLGLGTGDVIPVPSGSTSWWYNHGNSDAIIVFLGETTKAYVPGQFTYFLLTGPRGILDGFSTEFISRAYNINENEVNVLSKSQTAAFIVKLSPEERKSIPQPQPDQNIVNKWVKNNTQLFPDIHVERAGTITSFTGKNFPFLDEIGLSCSILKLEADAMLSPLFTTDFSVQVFYVAKGSGKVQIVGLNSKLVLDNKIVAGQLLVVPRFFIVAIIADGEGMECFSIKTTSRPADVADFASKQSVLNAFAPSILQSSLNVPPEFVQFFKGQMAKTDILIPPMN